MKSQINFFITLDDALVDNLFFIRTRLFRTNGTSMIKGFKNKKFYKLEYNEKISTVAIYKRSFLKYRQVAQVKVLIDSENAVKSKINEVLSYLK